MNDPMGIRNRPPKNNLESAVERKRAPLFFTPSATKLLVMTVVTFGMYNFYWFYKNWVYVKQRTAQSIMPFWRALFSWLWAYSLFEEINNSAVAYSVGQTLPAGSLAILYFASGFLWKLPDPHWLVGWVGLIPVLYANSVAMAVNLRVDTSQPINTRFSVVNCVAVFIGGVLWALIFVGVVRFRTDHLIV